MSEYARHRQPPDEWIPFTDRWVAELRYRNLSATTIEAFWYRLTAFARKMQVHPAQVQRDHIVDFMNLRNISNEGKRSYYNALSSFFSFMLSNKYRDDNPMLYMPRVKRGKKRQLPASSENVQIGFEKADPDTQLMIHLAVEAGLRRNEIASIFLPDDMIEEIHGWSLIVHGKGNKDRIVPLTSIISNLLLQRPNGWCFPCMYNSAKHVCPDTVYRHIKKTVGEPTHSLRRKFATDLYRATNGDMRVVQETLGHESVTTTQLYISIASDDLRVAINKLECYRHKQINY
ncbi:tyrosine-type recombinase/integrase [Alloscardovia omnicolens]|uniref:tyrosine-type recombinase/integrase n=1 Tax=Alloscardovia omnicolens TaxID=419015 RepID=UPI002550BE10|nr:tyrosine-type recombinase/integrase [Alloscardovia omnicolens]MDK6327244.1 tyrosine-type recombinase/integrase [Alloscardovia omnicolens]MDK8082001.1 tyrosine-type recombinase/integrase [Alloscardovia omnicolens]